MKWVARIREAAGGVLFRARADAELDEELRFHVEMEAQRRAREQGIPLAEARRQAAVAFGGVEKHKEDVRDARGLAWVTGMSLDIRLGARMLVRFWGLTLVGVLGMALAIALGTVFHAVTRVVHTPLPLAEGARIVALEVWDLEVSNQERRVLPDFALWQAELRTIVDLAAYRTVGRNLILAGGAAEPVTVAEMTASGFRVARVPALLGRTLLDEDEHVAAPPVVVLGHDVWQTRFAADPGIVGRDVRLGTTVHTVVGVMPEGFAFPLNHRFWVPLRADAAVLAPRQGPGIFVFGRLAAGATLDGARAELAGLGQRTAAAWPATHERLRPRVVPYTAQLFDDMQGWEIPIVHLMIALLLVVICANIAVLVYARTVTRAGEIAVRSALGASRERIIGQLFVEAVVLAAAAAVLGLGAARLSIDHLNALLGGWGGPSGAGGLPFWLEIRLSAATLLYALGLTSLGAVVVGVLPALKAAGGRVQPTLRQLGGGAGVQLGRTWTVLIVAQVALTVACLPPALSAGWKSMLHASADPGFAAGDFLVGALVLDRESAAVPDGDEAAFRQRYAELQAGIAARLEAEPGVAGVTFAVDLPGQEPTVRIEVDGRTSAEPGRGERVRFARVDPAFFEVFDVPLLAGRALRAADADDAATAVLVSRTFAEQLAGDGIVLGRRFHYVEGYRSGGVMRTPAGVALDRAYEVVGVVPDFPNVVDPDEVTARVYHALAPGRIHPVYLAVRAATASPHALGGRIRAHMATLEPALQVRDLRVLDDVLRETQGGVRMLALAIGLVMLSVLLLSSAGIYALMSFTVARRRREIGIRAALGADPRRLLGSIFSRALRQLGAGVLVGLLIAALLEVATGGEALSGRAAVLLPVVAALMLGVGAAAALGPARRGLRIEPTEALREE